MKSRSRSHFSKKPGLKKDSLSGVQKQSISFKDKAVLLSSELAIPVAYYILLAVGVATMLIPYLSNCSLWLDEAKLALNITDRGFIGLLNPLDYGQVAPVLFLFIEKINIIIFGNSEYSLRLFPLLCGILSLPLIYRLTKSLAGNAIPALIALFIFSTSINIICYTSDAKQYECDIFAALILLNLVFDTALSSNERKRYILLAVAGAVLIFMSNITVMVLFTIGVYYLFKYGLSILTRHRPVILMMACWVIAFMINYFCFLYNHPNRTYQDVQWQNDFMPVEVSSKLLSWICVKALSVTAFYAPTYKYIFLVAILFFIVKRQWLFLYLLLFPVILHGVISAFKLYPFYDRLILYLTAFITPMLGIALFRVLELISKWINKYVAAAIGIAFLLAPFFILKLTSLTILSMNNEYFQREEIKESINFITANSQPGQKVYVYYGAQFATMYYERINYIPFKNELVFGTENRSFPQNYLTEIQKLDGNVWILFSHNFPLPSPQRQIFDHKVITYYGELDYIMEQLTLFHKAKVLRSFRTIGSSAYLLNITS